jgi:hypothetical protein
LEEVRVGKQQCDGQVSEHLRAVYILWQYDEPS